MPQEQGLTEIRAWFGDGSWGRAVFSRMPCSTGISWCKATPLMQKSPRSRLQDNSNLWTTAISFCEMPSSLHFSSLLDSVFLVAAFLVCNICFSWALCAYHHQLLWLLVAMKIFKPGRFELNSILEIKILRNMTHKNQLKYKGIYLLRKIICLFCGSCWNFPSHNTPLMLSDTVGKSLMNRVTLRWFASV